jgi:hypothetical protein
MADIERELGELQAAYKAAVEDWVVAIREEEALASGPHSIAELDRWEEAYSVADKKHREVIYRKRLYEEGLRREFFGF